ncbi:UNVERIFIED_CONTAM: hypothetical protein Sradi_7093300 [Sesamum radiatum]|uniref:Reverse transcriptase domain-containing protein n=1 Tax=Sesamum radiatum TaxID=300843 RepID=A0AAW2J2K0_SESRA
MHDMHEPILLTVVYGANDVSTRRELWQGLTELAISADLPWLVGGDFNAVLDMSEVSGASGDIRVAMNDFNDCVIQTGLIPLPMQGERFSWHNCSTDGRSLWKRLDSIFVNVAWMEQWPNLFYTCLTPRTSDHSPLVLKGDNRDVQVSMFQFDNYLVLSLGFLASIHNIWQHPVIGTPMYSVTRKLKALKPVFHQQRRKKGDLAMNVKLAAGFLEVSQNCSRLTGTILFYCNLRTAAGGDQCSKAFFRRVATRRANKRIFQISDSDGLVQTDPTTISSVFVTYFQGLLGGDRIDRTLDLHYFRPWARHILTEEEACALIRPVTVDDVKIAIFDIEEDKGPGPDGFSSGFYKAAWPIVGEEISKAVMDFFTTGRWIEECVTSAHFSVVVNGGVHGFFAGALGLRQGDPMSLYLFVLVMEVLQMILQQFIDQDGQFPLWSSSITSILDAPLKYICHGGCAVGESLPPGLDLFASLSGLHINPQKSQLIISKAASGLRDSLLETLGFQEGHLPVRYLGLPLISARLSIVDCQPLLQKIDSRIKGWEGVQLSFAGRV